MTPRMSLITLLLVLAAGSALAQPMSGTYTVKIDGSGDFPSPMAAGAALSSRGISGHVVIDIYTGVYEQSSWVSLNSVSGASSYTITFKAATGQSVEITAPSYVFYGYYTPNVKVKGVTLRAASYGCYAFYNCHNWKIENCVIRSGSIGIYFDYYCNNESIIGNDIRAPSVGLYTYGYSTTEPNSGWYVANNFIYGWNSYGIMMYYAANHRFFYNSICGNGSFAYYGSYCPGDSWRNNIMVASTYVMYRYYCTPDSYPKYSNYNCYRLNGNIGGSSMFYSQQPSGGRGFNLAGWRTFSNGGDMQSMDSMPLLLSRTFDLHQRAGSPTIGNASPMPGRITTDIDGETRSTSTPDIGADEGTRSPGSPMAGTYYIKTAVVAGDTFPSFESATIDLAIRGQSGDVTFIVFGGTYNGQVNLNGLTNTPYWVNFLARTSGSPPVPDDVTIVAGASNGIELHGNKRIRFRNLNVQGYTSYGAYLNNITSVSPWITCDTVVFDGCRFMGPQGIYFLSANGGTSDDSVINCDFRMTSSYGIYLRGSTSLYTNRVVIANNFITGTTSYAIWLNYHAATKVYYNTVCNFGTTTGPNYLLYDQFGYHRADDTCTYTNNIFLNNRSLTTAYAIYKISGTATPPRFFKNNCLFVPNNTSGWVAYSMTTNYTYVTWRAAGFDTGGINVNPQVGGPLNLHLKTGSPCINAGRPIAGITKDIDGNTRSSSTPCIGADEYTTVGSPMSGVYTIKQDGTGDYRSFPQALGDVQLRGFGGTVQFDVYGGTYTGIPGRSGAFCFEGVGNGPNRLIVRGYPGEVVNLNCAGFSYGVVLWDNQRIRLQNLRIGGCSSYGLYANSTSSTVNTTDSCAFVGNTINSPQGIFWYYGDDDTIMGNFINVTSSYGMYIIGYSVSPYSQRNVIINNMVAGWTSYGIYMSYQNEPQLYFNSIQGTGSYALMAYYTTNMTMRNNILMGSLYAMYRSFGDNTPVSSNYNVFRLNGGGSSVIYSSAYGMQTLDQWRNSSYKDTNSLDVNPQFSSATDLHLQSSSPCINAGQTVSWITTDIDGDSRTANTPDIGADEYFIDIAARSIPSPVSLIPIGGTIQPSAVYRHMGGPRATFYAKMVITRGASPAYTDSVQVTVNPGDSVLATFANWTPTIVASNYRATSYHLIGGDGNPADDTVRKNFAVGNVDCGIISILLPPAVAPLGGTIYPRVVLRNYGEFPAQGNVRFEIFDPTDRGDNSTSVLATSAAAAVGTAGADNLAGTGLALTDRPVRTPEPGLRLDAVVYDTTQTVLLAVGAEETLSFTKSWTPAVLGNHTAACRVDVMYDTDPTNDSLTKPFVVERIDFGATRINAPAGNVTQNTSVSPSVTLKNYGSASAACAARVVVMSGATPVYDRTESGIVIGAGAEVTRVFATPWQATQLGPFTVTAYTVHEFDTDPTNDTMYGPGTVVPSGGGSGTWTCVSQMPSGAKPIGDGGWLAYADGPQRLYAARGNKQSDFFAFDPVAVAWEPKALIPDGTEGKKPSKGATATPYPSPEGKLYALKGNNTLGFWSYDLNQDSWMQLADIPQGAGKKIKGGSDLVYHDGVVYCLKGITSDFLAYDPTADTWTSLPSVPAPNTKFDKGSWLCLDEAAGKIYCHQAKYHAYYAYDIAGGTWGAALKGMPTINSIGKKKKSKDGGSGTFRNDNIYAFKGGNTLEFWKYTINGDSWSQLTDIPLTGLSGLKKKVKGGGDIVAFNPQPEPPLYAIKGNKTNELWMYESFSALGVAPRAERSGVMAVTTDNRRVSLSVSPNPLANGFATLSYSLSQPGAATVRVYDAAGRAVLVRSLAVGRSGQVGLDLRSLSAGVYLVKLSTESLTATHKLIVER